ncbi:coiled-coil domain-containing protein 172 [Ascaphus truei]|uniref:coiled-coil domain-containing protein 172 n=1 Tax=Ascaphus truei TaxID=8439 RepID=UPI003F5AA48B
MSLDSLFQQILLTEQQAQERRRLMQEVKSETNNCHENIKEVTEKLTEAKALLESKVYLLSEKVFQRDLLKKRQGSLGCQHEELLKEKQVILTMLQKIKKEMADEEEKFMTEVMDFNSGYGLTSNREILIREQVNTETDLLDREADILRKEMESMERQNFHLNSLQLQKDAIKRELLELQLTLKDVEDKIFEATATTKSLEAKKVKISQKPQLDTDCLRLKKELDSYKEDDLENVYEALRMEIEFLQAKLSQKASHGKKMNLSR